MFAGLAGDDRLRSVNMDEVHPNPDQPRKRFDPAALDLLAGSIAERGILQPPVVKETTPGRYLIVAGERRWRAARSAGLTTIDVLVDTDDRGGRTLEDALIENTAREDLTPVEEARAYRSLIDDLGISQAELARRVGRSRASINNHLRLLDLPGEILDLVDDGKLAFGHARALLAVDDPDQRAHLAHTAADEGWSARQVERAARDHADPAPAGTARQAPNQRPDRGPDAGARALEQVIRARVGADVTVTATPTRLVITASTPQHARALLSALGIDTTPFAD